MFDIVGDLDTPVSAFLKLQSLGAHVLLESVEGGERLGRYSFIGFGEARQISLSNGRWSVDGADGGAATSRDDVLNGLRRALAQAPRPSFGGGDIPLAGGLVGYAAYDLAHCFEPGVVPPDAGVPTLHYSAPRSWLAFDHVTRGIRVLHHGAPDECAALKRDVAHALRAGVDRRPVGGQYSHAIASMSRGDFLAGVATIQEHIAAGDVYQLVLSIRFAGRHTLDPFEAYRALRLINPSPYMYYVALGDVTVVGSSPEALVKLQGRRARLRPIAGTRPRGTDAAADTQFEAELLADDKENAEHVMLVDLARNDLGRVAQAGSVQVAPFKVVERYSHVMHMVSGVEGTLAEGHDAFDLFAAAFPAGTLVGAPKIRAAQLINQLEPVSRGLYGGTVGYFGAQGDMDQAITIRTTVFQGDEFSYQAGAGVVLDSVPAAEYAEVLAKAGASARALTLAAEGL